MRRVRERRVWLAVATAITAWLLLAAGCGGGDETSRATPGVAAEHAQSGGGADKRGGGRADGGSTSTAPTEPGHASPPAGRIVRMLAPFRDCLTRHGVAPIPSGTDARQAWLQRQRQLSPAQERAQIRARIACIPALPPRLRAGAEKLKRRYERRNS